MQENKSRETQSNKHAPAFSVQDEIRRDRHMRRTSRVRRARSAARSVLTAVLCMALCALLITAVFLTVTRVEAVTVSGNMRYSATEILQSADIYGALLPMLRERSVYARVSAACPYVESIQLLKVYPSSVEIVVHETEPVFATTIHGRQMTLDRELRVIDYTESAGELISLSLPEIKSAVEGSTVVFADSENETFIPALLDAFLGEERGIAFTSLDLTDRYDLTAIANGSVKILFGEYRNMDVKLTLAKKIIADAMAVDSDRTLIDVSEPSRASVQYDYIGEF